MSPVDFISDHPKLAFGACVVNLVTAYHIADFSFPLCVMQGFQLLAWTITILVGWITIYKSLSKWIKKIKKTD